MCGLCTGARACSYVITCTIIFIKQLVVLINIPEGVMNLSIYVACEYE